MAFTHLTARAPLAAYQQQAEELLAAHGNGVPEVLQLIHQNHPRFLDDKIVWLPKRELTESDIRNAPFTLEDARLTLARAYCFLDWPALVETVEAIASGRPPVAPFEFAVDAVITGDLATLQALLQQHPGLVNERSHRRTPFDPTVHGATLLHYLAANGVEGYRQKSPPNAVEVARLLLQSGADPNATAAMYGNPETTMLPMLASSTPPAEAGVQVPLLHILMDFGASLEPRGRGNWISPLQTALVFGFRDAAEALVQRGAAVDTLVSAAGLGRVEQTHALLPDAAPADRHRALALASQLGHTEIVRLLLESGEDPNRYNPDGFHSHATPLHHAALAGHVETARLLLQYGARTDIEDTIYHSTPLGWANYSGQSATAEIFRALPQPN